MKALMYLGPNNTAFAEINEPEPQDHEVKIKTLYCGICGSDMHGYTGESGRRIPPMIMGHEFCGIITAVGENVKTFYPGQRVAVQPINFCGHCPMCLAGNIQVCQNRRGLGVLDVNGAFAEYICVNEKMVYSLPDSVSDMQGALVEPLSVAYHAVQQLLPVEGKNILVIGTGVIGDLTIAWLKYFKAKTITAVGRGQEKLKTAHAMGADVRINSRDMSISDALCKAGLENNIDIAIECVGTSVTAQQTLDNVRIKGTVLWLGNLEKMVEINMQTLVTREVKILGSYGFNEREFGEVIEILGAGKINIDAVVSRIIPFEQLPKAFESLLEKPSKDLKVLVRIAELPR